MVMDVHLHAGCILMTYNAASPVKLVPLSDLLMGKLSTKKEVKISFLSLVASRHSNYFFGRFYSGSN